MIPSFTTYRLDVYELNKNLESFDVNRLCRHVVDLLSPSVVEHLPANFHNIDTVESAHIWLNDMVVQSRLFVVESKFSREVVGFIFASEEEETSGNVHIGYLLGENYWGKGLATELLDGFVSFSKHSTEWGSLTGGVSKDNFVSSKLLTKLGFNQQVEDGREVFFFVLKLRD